MALVQEAQRIEDGKRLPNWETNSISLVQQLDGNLSILTNLKAKYNAMTGLEDKAGDIADIQSVIDKVKTELQKIIDKYK